jgi:putative Holliday junction resolvase
MIGVFFPGLGVHHTFQTTFKPFQTISNHLKQPQTTFKPFQTTSNHFNLFQTNSNNLKPDKPIPATFAPSMGRILAIDFGLKRTGIAVTDPLKIIASALTTVPTREVLDFIQQYCAKEEVEFFVLGLPLHMDGNPAQIAPQADAFAERLQKLFPEKKVIRQDERNTSNDAKKIILQSGIKKQKRRDKMLVDKIAAALILEQFMEEHYWN